MMDELKPCPICETEAHIGMTGNIQAPAYWAECMKPVCRLSTTAKTSVPLAVAAWNKRAGEDRLRGLLAAAMEAIGRTPIKADLDLITRIENEFIEVET